VVWIPRVPVRYSLPLSLGADERNFVTRYSGKSCHYSYFNSKCIVVAHLDQMLHLISCTWHHYHVQGNLQDWVLLKSRAICMPNNCTFLS